MEDNGDGLHCSVLVIWLCVMEGEECCALVRGEQGAPALGLPQYVGLLELIEALAICMAIMVSLPTRDMAGGGRTAIPVGTGGVGVMNMLL